MRQNESDKQRDTRSNIFFRYQKLSATPKDPPQEFFLGGENFWHIFDTPSMIDQIFWTQQIVSARGFQKLQIVRQKSKGPIISFPVLWEFQKNSTRSVYSLLWFTEVFAPNRWTKCFSFRLQFFEKENSHFSSAVLTLSRKCEFRTDFVLQNHWPPV